MFLPTFVSHRYGVELWIQMRAVSSRTKFRKSSSEYSGRRAFKVSIVHLFASARKPERFTCGQASLIERINSENTWPRVQHQPTLTGRAAMFGQIPNAQTFRSFEALTKQCRIHHTRALTRSLGADGHACSICQDVTEPKEDLVRVPCCNKTFGVDCLWTWLSDGSAGGRCPLCRTCILEKPRQRAVAESSSTLAQEILRALEMQWEEQARDALRHDETGPVDEEAVILTTLRSRVQDVDAPLVEIVDDIANSITPAIEAFVRSAIQEAILSTNP